MGSDLVVADVLTCRSLHNRHSQIPSLAEAGIYGPAAAAAVGKSSYLCLPRNRCCSNSQARSIPLCSHMGDYCCCYDYCNHPGYFDTVAVVGSSWTAVRYYTQARVVGVATDLVAASLYPLHLLFQFLFHHSGRALVFSSAQL